MNNKKLLGILLKDLHDLEDLVHDQNKREFSALEMEFLRSRLNGMKGMLQLLEQDQTVQNIKAPEASGSEEQAIASDTADEEPLPVPEKKKHNDIPKDNSEEIEPIVKEAPIVKQKAVKADQQELVSEIKVKAETKEVNAPSHSDLNNSKETAEVQEQTPPPIEKPQRLGESFSKEKSVNDMVTADANKLEHKLSNRPVASIQAAIGINDRFQYIRELFEGDADAFSKAVEELDSKTDIGDATRYIKDNFSWEKNETSLKFVQLIKRRFLSNSTS